MKEIITNLDELGERAQEIDVRKENALMREIVSELKQTIKKKGLTSLSAPAIGYNYRIFCIDFKDLEIKTFINPIITNIKGFELSKETCTSIPDRTFIRPRHNDISVTYQRPMGQIESRQLVGLAAIVFQHEIDHLDGLLLSDVGLEIDEEFENASEEEREDVINMYLDSLDIKRKEIDTQIHEDKDLKQMSDAIDFMEKVQKGEVTLEK